MQVWWEKYGVNVPKGIVVSLVAEVKQAIIGAFLEDKEVVVKIQVIVGGWGSRTFKNGFEGGVHISKRQWIIALKTMHLSAKNSKRKWEVYCWDFMTFSRLSNCSLEYMLEWISQCHTKNFKWEKYDVRKNNLLHQIQFFS